MAAVCPSLARETTASGCSGKVRNFRSVAACKVSTVQNINAPRTEQEHLGVRNKFGTLQALVLLLGSLKYVRASRGRLFVMKIASQVTASGAVTKKLMMLQIAEVRPAEWKLCTVCVALCCLSL